MSNGLLVVPREGKTMYGGEGDEVYGTAKDNQWHGNREGRKSREKGGKGGIEENKTRSGRR